MGKDELMRLAIVATLVCLLLALTACGGDSPNAPPPNCVETQHGPVCDH